MADECVDVTVPAPVMVQVQTSQGLRGATGPAQLPSLVQETVAGPTALDAAHEGIIEVTASASATVTLNGTLGTQTLILWSGTAGTVEGASMDDGDAAVAVRLSTGWSLFPVAPLDSTPPDPGTLIASSVTSDGFTLLVQGASDAGGLDPEPFAFSTDGGSTFSAWQASAAKIIDGLDPSTTYQCVARVRDAAGGTADTATVPVTTNAATTPMQLTHTDTFGDETDGTSFTWTAANLGTPDPARRIILGVAWRGVNYTTTVPTVTIGGVAASRIGTNGSIGASGITFFTAAVPTGATGDVSVTFDVSVFRVGMVAWSAGKDPTLVDEDVITSPGSTSIVLTTSATSEQAAVGLAVLFTASLTGSPVALDTAQQVGSGTYMIGGWHQNGGNLSETVTTDNATGSIMQVTLG